MTNETSAALIAAEARKAGAPDADRLCREAAAGLRAAARKARAKGGRELSKLYVAAARELES